MPEPSPAVPAQLFYSYSHKDERLRDQLETHLAILRRQRLISDWHDRKITAGAEWKNAIEGGLKAARIILLLVSPDFLASDYCYDIELKLAMERHSQGDARVIPVILRPCDWTSAPFAGLQALPTNGKPVSRWSDRDEAFLNVELGIRKALLELPSPDSSGRREWIVEINVQIGSFDQPAIQRIVNVLRDMTGDPLLTLRRIEEGSVRLILWSSEAGYSRILDLFDRGLLRTLIDYEVGHVGPVPALLQARDLAAARITSVSALHQLPAPPADFTGRGSELTELFKAVKSGRVTVVGLQGMGGVGKTALALKLAEQLKPDYPDAQFYLDLKGASAQSLNPRDAMAHVVRVWHPTAQLPEKEDEIAALYRSVLDGKRALLLMDNARDGEQVKLLIPPQSCLLLVTSRQHFMFPGMARKNLNEMPHGDACSLLLKIVPRLSQEKQETIDKLAELCGHLPLALETVGSMLSVRSNLTPVAFTQSLTDAQKRLKLTQTNAALQASYDLLPESTQKDFHLLAVFPDSFDTKAAAAMWMSDEDRAQDRLGELLAYSLIEFDESTRRYRLHDLVRLFAGQFLSAEERNTAQKRHAGHYLQVLAAADDLYLKGGESVTRGLALFDAEWTNIQAGHDWVVTHQQDDDAVAEWCWRYPDAGVYCLDLRQHPRENILWLEPALVAARRLKQRGWEGAALGNLGIAYKDLGEYRRAIEYHEQHLEIAREIGDRMGEGAALGNLGIAYDALGEYRRAIDYHEQDLEVAREIGDRMGEGAALGNLGIAYKDLGEYRRAIEYHEQHLEIAREIGDRREEGEALGNLGITYDALGEYRRAIEYQEQALAIDKALGNRMGESQDLGNLGIAYKNLGEYRVAIAYHEQSLQIKREIGDRLGEANSLFNSALALDNLGNRPEAVTRSEGALKIYEAIESPHAAKVRDRLAKWRGEDKAPGPASAE